MSSNQSNHSNAALYLETLSAIADGRLKEEAPAEFKIPLKYLEVFRLFGTGPAGDLSTQYQLRKYVTAQVAPLMADTDYPTLDEDEIDYLSGFLGGICKKASEGRANSGYWQIIDESDEESLLETIQDELGVWIEDYRMAKLDLEWHEAKQGGAKS